MDFKYLAGSVKNILSNPEQAWINIETEKKKVSIVRNSLLLPMIALVSLAVFTGSMMFSNAEQSLLYSLFVATRTFLVQLTTVYVAAFIMDEVTFPLDLGRDFRISFTIITFSLIPFFVCSMISGIFESLLFVNIIALYGLYIFWEGTVKFLNPPKYKRMPLLIATTVVTVFVYFAADFILKTIMDKVFYAFFS